MPNVRAWTQVERRLVELGCPLEEVRRRVRELEEHHEDLKAAALADGLPADVAEVRASELLGPPVFLAEHLAAALRRSSWWGRHRVLGFCVLPPLGIFAAAVVGLQLVLGGLRLCFTTAEWNALADEGAGFELLARGVQGAYYLAIALVPVVFCWVAQRAAAGLRWALAACTVCSFQGYFAYWQIVPHATTVGFSSSPNWICGVIPLFVAAMALARQRRLEMSVAGIEPVGTGRARE